ncbi:type IX secretion system outer membrane channel protein PorV [Crocinitomicaceae bacterium]|nr:type IX secretion system outer membrane channel protein PorV [Crocinitomicaceae bacterium]
MNTKIITAVLSAIPMFALAQPTGVNDPSQLDGKLGLNTITTALPFMSITPDSRAGGMGDAGTALSPSSLSIYWNTSNLIFAKEKAEIGLSYVPWLRQLTNDIHLSYLSGYSQLGDRHVVGGSLRFFSLGSITFTTDDAQIIREDKPSEYELTGAYGFRLSEKMAIGVNGKFAYSNLTGGLTVGGIDSKPAIAGAADLSFTYFNEDAKFFGRRGSYTFGATINNIGNKVSYSSAAVRDFIPANLKIGNAFTLEFDDFNALTWSIDVQKLLVPTPPRTVSSTGAILAGQSSDVGTIAGVIQSFYDAPGALLKDDNGDKLYNDDGTEQIVKGSKLKEELNEIMIATGFEYWYNDLFALRAGIFHEAATKGNRQFYNAGVGLKYNAFLIDISYLGSLNGRNSPLANTLRFTMRLTLGK